MIQDLFKPNFTVASLTLPLLLGFSLSTAQAVVISSGDGTGNTEAPPDDPGFKNVGTIGQYSGVYLGKGWVITANHVGTGTLSFDGNSSAMIPDSHIRLTGDGSGLPDLSLIKMVLEPDLPTLNLALGEPPEGEELILIGSGRNRGAATTWMAFSGWIRAGPGPIRWGTNEVSVASQFVLNTYVSLFNFDDSTSPDSTDHESQGVVGDSGGAAFWKSDGTWYLSGILIAIYHHPGQPLNYILYGNQTAVANLAPYRSEILSIIEVPACSNGLDDDIDGEIDSEADPGCTDATDTSERSPLLPCDDGIDNDEDGTLDYPADLDCESPLDATGEFPALSLLVPGSSVVLSIAFLALGWRALASASTQSTRRTL